MEPENLNETTEEVVEMSQLHKVTPLSKYLAMLLFIILPFIGGWIGYNYAPEKVVEVEKVLEVEKVSVNDVVEVETNEDDFSEETTPYIDLTQRHDYYMKETGLSYDVSSNTIRIRDINAPSYFSDNFEADYQILSNVIVADDIIEVTVLPYLSILSSTTDKIFLTRHCFKASECRHRYLYEFDRVNQILDKMEIGEFYTDMGSEFSPFNRFIITYGFDRLENGDVVDANLLLALDLYTDTIIKLDSEKTDTGFRFCFPSMVCDLNIEWLSEDVIEVLMYNPDGTEETRLYSLNP